MFVQLFITYKNKLVYCLKNARRCPKVLESYRIFFKSFTTWLDLTQVLIYLLIKPYIKEQFSEILTFSTLKNFDIPSFIIIKILEQKDPPHTLKYYNINDY